MMITKRVDMGADVEVNIDANDVASALSEAFEHVTRDDYEAGTEWSGNACCGDV